VRETEIAQKLFYILDEVVIHGGYLLSHTNPDKTSLKEALDEAHGHEHNEDGSEMTPAQRAAREAEKQQQATGGKPVIRKKDIR